MYGLFGKMLAHPGKRDELLALLLRASDVMRDINVAGNYLYVINSDPNDPNAIWVYEAWRTKEDWQASLTYEEVKAVIASARPLIASFGERFEVTPMGGKGLPETAGT